MFYFMFQQKMYNCRFIYKKNAAIFFFYFNHLNYTYLINKHIKNITCLCLRHILYILIDIQYMRLILFQYFRKEC